MPEDSLKVAIVCPEFRTSAGGEGGLATSVDFIESVAATRGWETQVFSPRMSRKAAESRQLLNPSTWPRRIKLAKRSDGVITIGAHLAEFEPIRYQPRRVLDRALDEFDVIVIVAGSPAAATVSRRSAKPVVLAAASLVSVERARALDTAEGALGLFRTLTTRLVARMDRRALRIPTQVLVLNPWMRQACIDAGARVVKIAPPGVDTRRFCPPVEYVEAGPLVMVARLGDARKDYPTLLRSYAAARDRGLDVPLIVAGRGQLSPADSGLLGSLGIADNVSVLSDLGEPDLVRVLQQASLFVMSSSEEGLGLSIVEGMACGLPVVSTATEGARYVLGDSSAGELVPVGDVQALAAALVDWVSDSNRRHTASVEARRRATEVFSLGATGEIFAAAIEETAGRGGSKR